MFYSPDSVYFLYKVSHLNTDPRTKKVLIPSWNNQSGAKAGRVSDKAFTFLT